MSQVYQIAILGLFAFLLIGGMMSSYGSVCGRGWLAFLMLPLAAAVGYTLLNNLLPQMGADAGDAEEGAAAEGAVAPPSLMGFAVFLAFFQYLTTAIMVMIQKPAVPKYDVFRKSFVAAGISFLVSMVFIAGFKGAAGPFKLIGRLVPRVGKAVTAAGISSVAMNPLVMLGALAAHGIACSAM
jgi:hypothetical protein